MLTMTANASATTLVKKTLDDLVKEADAIVIGTVTDTKAHVGADKDVHTLVTVNGLRVLHGRYAEPSLTLRVAGGQSENEGLVVHGSPRFAAKDRVILFINGNGTQMVPFVGWIQGVFRLEKDARGRERVVDHDRNPVVEVRGADVVKDVINPPDATIVADPARAGSGGGGSSDDGAQARAVERAASGREAMDSASFIAAITRKVRETGAAGRTVRNAGDASAAAAQPRGANQDAAPPQR
jgi:hypothetical protein